MSKVKIGIIGCGKQAEKHLSGLKKLSGVDFVVADIREEASRTFAEKSCVQWVAGPADIFADQSVRAVVICTPTSAHVDLIKEAVKTGKDVFCEKPLAGPNGDLSELDAMAKSAGRIVMIGYVYRYVPILEEGHRLFRKLDVGGRSLIMGKPLTAFFRLGGRGSHQAWKHRKTSDGGAINEMLVHMIDLANWYFGPLAGVEVVSHSLKLPQRQINGDLVDADADDYVVVKCIGEGGVEIICQADLVTPAFSQYVEIQAENGSFMGSIQADMPSYVFLREGRGGYQTGRTELRTGQRNLFDVQMLAFAEAVLKRQQPDRNSISDSIQLMHILKDVSRQVEDK